MEWWTGPHRGQRDGYLRLWDGREVRAVAGQQAALRRHCGCRLPVWDGREVRAVAGQQAALRRHCGCRLPVFNVGMSAVQGSGGSQVGRGNHTTGVIVSHREGRHPGESGDQGTGIWAWRHLSASWVVTVPASWMTRIPRVSGAAVAALLEMSLSAGMAVILWEGVRPAVEALSLPGSAPPPPQIAGDWPVFVVSNGRGLQ